MASIGCRPPVTFRPPIPTETLPNTVAELLQYAEAQAGKQDALAMQKALEALDKAHRLDPTSYESAWKAARASTWLADELSEDKNKRAQFARLGIGYAKAAIEIDRNRVEGHFYEGEDIGLLATTKLIGGRFDVPKVRDAEKRAAAIDGTYDHGGPYRVLGSLYAEAPPWPASIGDVDQGVEFLEKAVSIAPDYPFNHLRLGNAYAKQHDSAKALAEYQTVINAQPQPEFEHQLARWKRLAQQGIDDVTRKQSYP
jgi:tetratricopeptide (TPR) repeat protein